MILNRLGVVCIVDIQGPSTTSTNEKTLHVMCRRSHVVWERKCLAECFIAKLSRLLVRGRQVLLVKANHEVYYCGSSALVRTS